MERSTRTSSGGTAIQHPSQLPLLGGYASTTKKWTSSWMERSWKGPRQNLLEGFSGIQLARDILPEVRIGEVRVLNQFRDSTQLHSIRSLSVTPASRHTHSISPLLQPDPQESL